MGKAERYSRVLAEQPVRLPHRGGFLQAAYAYLAANAEADTRQLGGISPETERGLLEGWALENGRMIDASFFDALTFVEGKSEHHVFHHPQAPGCLLKRWNDKPYFPRDYLERWMLSNLLFGDEADLEGFTTHSESRRVVPVIRQPFRTGVIPDEASVYATLEALGFERTEKSGVWIYRELGIDIADVEPHNFVQEPESGRVFPIDLRPGFLPQCG